MSTERKELLHIHSLLMRQEYSQSAADQANASDLAILRKIISLVRETKLNEQLDESLAFDGDTRDKLSNELRVEAQDQIWQPLEKFDDQLRRDYTCRRQMLLSRLDCTIESFKWKGSNKSEPKGGRAKSMNEQIHETYDKTRPTMKDEPQVSMARLLAVREKDCDRLLNGIVSSSPSADCKINYKGDKQAQSEMVNLKQVIIPNVPDRGGRTDEVRPPPKETFGQQRGRGRGGGGRHFRQRGSNDCR